MSFNGYLNRETWAVSLWLENTESDYTYLHGRAVELLEDLGGNQDAARAELADEIKDAIEEGIPIEKASLYLDLLTASISAVDFDQVAAGFIEGALS